MSATLSKLSNYISLHRWREALSLAVQSQPEAVESLLAQAGNSFFNRGEYQELHDLLISLPISYQNKPEALYWLFRTALRLRQAPKYLKQVESLLNQEEAPNLRALYASHYLTMPEKLQELERAKQHQDSFFIRHQYALVILKTDLAAAIKELEDLCETAQTANQSFDYQQSLNLLGYCYAQQGRFKQTLACFTQVNILLRNESNIDWQLYLSSCNNLLNSQLVVNELSNSQELINVITTNLDSLQTDLFFHSRATLGDYWLSQEDPHKALAFHQENYELYLAQQTINNHLPDTFLLDYLKMLLHLNKHTQAKTILNNHKEIKTKLSEGEKLAECLLLAHYQLGKSKDIQGSIDSDASKALLNQLSAIDTLDLTIDLQIIKLSLEAHLHLAANDIQKASDLLATRPIQHLSIQGFRLLFASNAYDHVFNFWLGNDLLAIIKDPKAFEELANDEATWHRLALLKDFPDEIAQVRYAQYLSSQNKFEEANDALNPFVDDAPSPLVIGTYLSSLLASGDSKTFEAFLDYEVPTDPSPLNAEGRIKIHEALAGYLYTQKNLPKLAQQHLLKEEAIATELGLVRRQKIIKMLLEEVNASLGENMILEPLNLKGLKITLQKQQRQRFDSILNQTNLLAAQTLLVEEHIDLMDLNLVGALKLYRDAENHQVDFLSCTKQIQGKIPTHPESKLYFALLCLQIYAKTGPLSPETSLKFILELVESALSEIPNLDLLFPLTARIFPLGLAMMSHLNSAFSNARTFVSIVLPEEDGGGIYRKGEKVATLPPLVQDALVTDGLNATVTALEAAFSSKTGFTAHKGRLAKALSTAELEAFELTNVGAIYRGLSFVKQELDYQSLIQEALEEPYLKAFVQNL